MSIIMKSVNIDLHTAHKRQDGSTLFHIDEHDLLTTATNVNQALSLAVNNYWVSQKNWTLFDFM
jgi:hypothetical protein